MADIAALVDDLRTEQRDLGTLLAALGAADWARPTPAPGWSVAHQLAHLAYFDRTATTALNDPAAFAPIAEAAAADPEGFAQRVLLPYLDLSPSGLLAAWQESAAGVADALLAAPGGTRVPWFGPPMSVASKASARIMETWAHGQDVYDTAGVSRPATPRLRHIARLALRARPYSYLVRGRPAPTTAVQLKLTGPGGQTWIFADPAGSDAAAVEGDAMEFCLVMTRRRHRDDTSLVASGEAADEWLTIGQAYAGPPGPGRPPSKSPAR
jgi:uncharacterized protein (TIGR03084 family)